ncbi:MAG TPA: amidohydrolase family protein [Candidatus Binatia bacterium]|nr:amidohydrolase family protein [Candidatus Binatia bacterium]
MRTVFSGGRVFDPRSLSLVEADVAIEDERVVEVARHLDGDHHVDATDRSLLPGLFDCHVHIAMSHIDSWRHLQTPLSYRFYDAARSLLTTLRAGITTIRDAGGADLGMKRAVDDGLIPGPRLRISLTMLSQTGGHGDPWLPSGALGEPPVYPGMPSAVADGPEELRRKVRELIRDGADVIKVATSGGVLSAQDDPRHPQFAADELEALVREAAAAERWVMAHAQSTVGIKNAIRAGVRSIEHGVFLDDEAIELMRQRGTWLVPTLVAVQGVIDAAAAGAQIPEASLRKAHDVKDAHAASFRRAVAAGVRIALGTDSPITPHGRNLRELPLMVEGGMTPGGALAAATISAAELLGVEDELGSLEPGKRADLVLVSGDPYQLDTLPARIESVWKDGVEVARSSPA